MTDLLYQLKHQIRQTLAIAKQNKLTNEEFLALRALQEQYERQLFTYYCGLYNIQIERFSDPGSFSFWDAFVISGDSRVLCEIKDREYNSYAFTSTMLPHHKWKQFVDYKGIHPGNHIYSFSFWTDGICTEHDLSTTEFKEKFMHLPNETGGNYSTKRKKVIMLPNTNATLKTY